MTQVGIVTTDWSGAAPAGSVTKTHFTRSDFGTIDPTDAENAAGSLNNFYNDIMAVFPLSASYAIRQVVNVINGADEATLADVSGASPFGSHPGTGSDDYVVGSGIRLAFKTSTIVRSRHVKGAMYLVPTSRDAREADGHTTDTALSLLATKGAALIASFVYHALVLVVYSRPKPSGATNGEACPVTAVVPRLLPANLHKREY